MSSPILSVLMTAFNREKYIGEAIESILSSTFQDFELIIVDDCSSDNTISIAKKYALVDTRVLIHKNDKNLGDYPNRNIAASYARGKYIKYVDSDDMISSDALEVMVASMEKFPEAGLGVSIRNSVAIKYYTPREAYYCHFFVKGLLDYGPSAVIINTEKFRIENGFMTLNNVSDNDLWLRLSAKYPVIEVNDGLIFWRQHEFQQIVLYPESYLEYHLSVLMKNLNTLNCPLDEKDVNWILKKYRRQLTRSLLKFGLKTFRLKFVFKVFNKYSLKPYELF